MYVTFQMPIFCRDLGFALCFQTTVSELVSLGYNENPHCFSASVFSRLQTGIDCFQLNQQARASDDVLGAMFFKHSSILYTICPCLGMGF